MHSSWLIARLCQAILPRRNPPLGLPSGRPTVVVALGTGRAVRAAVERVSPIDRPNHQIVSLVGNISADGSASFFDTVGRLADLTKSRHYPMPLPFLLSSEKERDQMLRLEPISKVRAIAAKADLRLVGIGQMDQHAQVLVDGFVTRQELFEMMRRGAAGELTGWAFDVEGQIIDSGTNRRLTSIPPRVPAAALTIGAAVGIRGPSLYKHVAGLPALRRSRPRARAG